ncbi:MAG: hypothetical protein ACSI46_20100 [Gloeotrichia echinulata DVL01]|jgi:hypothetical protein
MNLKNIALVTGLAVSGIAVSSIFAPAQSATVTYGGKTYDVVVITTSFAKDSDLLKKQPWWGNEKLALFVGNQDPKDYDYVAYDHIIKSVKVAPPGSVLYDQTIGKFAVLASSVPEPSTILASITILGLGASLKLKLARQ